MVKYINDSFSVNTCTSNNTKYPYRSDDIATVVGTAKCVMSDVEKYGLKGDIFAVNDSGFYLKKVHHVVSAHGNMVDMVNQYRTKFRSTWCDQYQTHTALFKDIGFTEKEQLFAQHQWEFKPKFKSSGILAVFIAISLGYKKINVHGIPLDEGSHFYSFHDDTSVHYKNFLYYIEENNIVEVFKDNNVEFSSGNLKRLCSKN